MLSIDTSLSFAHVCRTDTCTHTHTYTHTHTHTHNRLESEKSKAVLAAREQFTKELTDTKQHMSEQHAKEIMKLKSHHEAESGSVEAAVNRTRENWEREKLVSMEDAVRKARVKWLKEEEV